MPTGSVDAGEDACVACVREVDFTSPQLIEIKLLLNDYDILDHVVRVSSSKVLEETGVNVEVERLIAIREAHFTPRCVCVFTWSFFFEKSQHRLVFFFNTWKLFDCFFCRFMVFVEIYYLHRRSGKAKTNVFMVFVCRPVDEVLAEKITPQVRASNYSTIIASRDQLFYPLSKKWHIPSEAETNL